MNESLRGDNTGSTGQLWPLITSMNCKQNLIICLIMFHTDALSHLCHSAAVWSRFYSLFKVRMLHLYSTSPFCMKRCAPRMEGLYSCSFKTAVEVVSEMDRNLCKRTSWHGYKSRHWFRTTGMPKSKIIYCLLMLTWTKTTSKGGVTRGVINSNTAWSL